MTESGAGLPSDRTRAQANQTTSPTPAPLYKCAFDHPETRAAWENEQRAAKRRTWFWHSLYALCFIALGAVHGNVSSDLNKSRAVGVFVILSFVYFLSIVYRRRDAMASLKRIRRVLEQHPWEFIPAAHRASGVKDLNGVAVRLRYLEGAELTGLLSARKPTRRRHWPEALEAGAWYAGEVRLEADGRRRGFGVLATPGGSELLEVSGVMAVRWRQPRR
ncbi:hypothetical protein J7I94_29530 [Streptomyces sp. ISL-12]|uniref:hypothetical protein n=1 Tax=Streptomyces sp. ISL-12 TaxID=2819177 RepID=UPI001BE82875|nr:hypothetical protein [Streptomyces sp. ISL-12]MBT2414642.1 hypothetical protein [Streptomyces sp. ISL-12]